jgi:hypothetical protein
VACASRCPPAASTAAPVSATPGRPRSSARQSDRVPAACNSVWNAGTPIAPQQFVAVTHPFHPYAGQRGFCVGERANRAGKRLLLRFDDGRICAVPPQWTDAVAPDLEVSVGGDRALCRLTDLLELALFMARLTSKRRTADPALCKDNSAAFVKRITPRSPWVLR